MIKLVEKDQISELKRFAVTMMWVFPLIFMGLLPWLFEGDIPWWPLALSILLGGLYFVYPKGLYIPYRIWMAIAMVLGWVNTRLVLAFAFYVLILPIGLVLRLFNKLQYKKKMTKSAQKQSYYHDVESGKSPESLKDPF